MVKTKKVLLTIFNFINGLFIFPIAYFFSSYVKQSNENDREGITLEFNEVVELMSGFLVSSLIALLLFVLLSIIYWKTISKFETGFSKFLWIIVILLGFVPGQFIYLFTRIWPTPAPAKEKRKKEEVPEKKYNTL